MLYLAIDQHRKQLTVNVRNEAGDVVLRRQVSTQWEKVRQFFEALRADSPSGGGFVAILELCGFNHWLLKMLDDFGCRQTVLIRATQRSSKKTDHRDANALGEVLWANRKRVLEGKKVQNLKQIVLPTPADDENRQLTALRQRVVMLRTRTINKVQKILLKHNLQQECPTKGLQTKKAQLWLKQMPLGQIDRLEMNQLLSQWDLWDQQLLELENKIKERQRKHPLAAIVATMPGAGAYTSLALACRIGSIERFPRPQSLANYWGLTPRCRNSGEATDRLGSITKEGSALARFLLGQMVVHVLRRDAAIRQWYREIKKRRGSKIARVAVMRRSATILWHMMKHNEAYVVGGPPRSRLATSG